jgi:hypothetical protein
VERTYVIDSERQTTLQDDTRASRFFLEEPLVVANPDDPLSRALQLVRGFGPGPSRPIHLHAFLRGEGQYLADAELWHAAPRRPAERALDLAIVGDDFVLPG